MTLTYDLYDIVHDDASRKSFETINLQSTKTREKKKTYTNKIIKANVNFFFVF